MKKLMLCLLVALLSGPVMAQNYNLKRIAITFNGGFVSDSAIGSRIKASGDMTINGSIITQNIRYCDETGCLQLVENASGDIVEVAGNAARVTVRRHEDGVLDDLTILSLHPNIITMYVYDDGTVETHEWEPAQ